MSPTKGDWLGWVGTYEDIVQGREGQYRVRIMDKTKGADCAYPGLELLPCRKVEKKRYFCSICLMKEYA